MTERTDRLPAAVHHLYASIAAAPSPLQSRREKELRAIVDAPCHHGTHEECPKAKASSELVRLLREQW